MKKIQIRMIALADQIFFSAANFILTILLARHYSEVEFAGYVIGLSIALTVQGIQRSCYVVQNSVLAPAILRRRIASVLGEQMIFCMFLIGIEIIAAAIVYAISNDPYHHSIVISTIICSLIYMQLEFDRMVFVKHEKNLHPFLASLCFIILIGALFFGASYAHLSYFSVMAMIGLYTILKALFLFSSIAWPDIFWGWRLAVRDFKRYFAGSILGVIGYAGHNHMPVFVLGWYAAPLQSAVFGAMRGLMQPLQIIAKSLDIIDKNFFHAHVAHDGDVGKVLLRQLAMYGGFAVLVMLGTLLCGDFVVRLAYGEKYAAYSHILLGWALIFGMLAITLPLETVIVKLNKLNSYNTYRLASGLVGTVLSFLLWEPYGSTGAVIACLAGWIVSIVISFWLVWPVFRKKENP